MVNLVNLKNELKKYFTLRSDKEKVWTDYLKEDTNYINGSVYFYNTSPRYHNQSFDGVNLLPFSESYVDLVIYNKGDELSEYQIKQSSVSHNGVNVPVNNRVNVVENNRKGLALRIPFNTEGEINVIVPSINLMNDFYQGFDFKLNILPQSITITNLSKTSSNISFKVSVSNVRIGQIVSVHTLFRNGDTNTTVHKNVVDTNPISVSLPLTSSDVSVAVVCNPYTKDKYNMYSGSYKKINL